MMPKFLSTLKGFEGYTAISENGKIKISYDAADIGEDEVLVKKSQHAFTGSEAYEDYLVEGWKPYMRLAPVNEELDTGEAYTTQQLTAKLTNSKTPWMPKFFVNPMQDMDYMIYEGLAKNTFVGPLINAYTRFIIGTGFRPELELIHPEDYSDDEKQKMIADNQDIIKSLNEIDRHFNTMSNGMLNTPLIDLVSMLVDSMFTFNRAALVFAYDTDNQVVVDGKKFKEIPTHLRYAHPRELGIIEVDPDTWDLKTVQWQYSMNQVEMKDMIYLWDPLIGAKYRDSMYYGGSVITPMADAARVIRQLVGDDFPAMARSTWAGMPIIVVKPKGQTVAEKENEFGGIVRKFVRGAPNILVYDPADVDVHQIDFTPKVEEFRKLLDSLHRLCVADVGMPQTLFFDETTSTRSCHTEDTLTLTEDGYKSFRDIDWRTEKIATYNPETKKTEYHYPTGISVYDYEGDMIHIKNRLVDVMVTPDHRMWASKRHEPKFQKWQKVKAKDLMEWNECNMLEYGIWEGEDVPEQYPLNLIFNKNRNANMAQATSVHVDTWLEFMGYYLSEGYRTKYRVELSQNKDSPTYEKMKACFNKMPYRSAETPIGTNASEFNIHSKEFATNFEDTGGRATTKRVPRWMLKLQPDKLQILFDAMMAGDGTVQKNGWKRYYTASYGLAQDVQEIANKMGYTAVIKDGETPEMKSKKYGKSASFYPTTYYVGISKHKKLMHRIKKPQITRVPYKGKVYCYEVPNHLFITQRNGKSIISHNTMLGKIQLAMSTVINPVRERIGRQFSPQWYDRWFRLVYKGDPRLKIFSIKMQFDDLHIEKWFDKIESVNMMDGRQRLKDNAYGDMAGVENYVAKVDPDAKVAPGGDTSLLQPTETPDGRQELREKEAA